MEFERVGDNVIGVFDEASGELRLKGKGELWEIYVYENFTKPFQTFGCKVRRLVIEEGITRTPLYAFDNCDMREMFIPASLQYCPFTRVENYNLRAFHVNSASPLYSSDTSGILYDKSGTKMIRIPRGAASCVIPEGVRVVGEGAGHDCRFTELHIPRTVKKIEKWAFANCSALTTLTIAFGLYEIGEQAFAGAGIKSVTLPSSVERIGKWAFNCNDLRSVTIWNPYCEIVEGNGGYGYNDNRDLAPCERDVTLGRPGLTVIRGHKDSSAEKYAQKNGYRFEILDEPWLSDLTAELSDRWDEIFAPKDKR